MPKISKKNDKQLKTPSYYLFCSFFNNRFIVILSHYTISSCTSWRSTIYNKTDVQPQHKHPLFCPQMYGNKEKRSALNTAPTPLSTQYSLTVKYKSSLIIYFLHKKSCYWFHVDGHVILFYNKEPFAN